MCPSSGKSHALRVPRPRAIAGITDAITSSMATHAQLPIDYDTITRRVARREQANARSLLPFALAVILATAMWVAFVEYL
jgi:hypothetical protein